MDYRDEVFLAVAEHLSFSKAARALYISQPAVTRHIKQLESKLDVALFQRVGSRVYLTPAGKVAFNALKTIRQQYAGLSFALGELNDSFRGTLRIGASSTISQYVLPSALAAYNQRYPKIKVTVFNGNSFEMEQKLLSNDVDMSLVENHSGNSGLRYLNFMEDEIVPVARFGGALVKTSPLKLADLLHLPLVLRERGSGTREVLEQMLTKQGVNLSKLNVLIHLGSTEAIKSYLTNSEGIAFLSRKAVVKEFQLKLLQEVVVSGFFLTRNFRMALRQGPEMKVPSSFVNFISSYNFLL